MSVPINYPVFTLGDIPSVKTNAGDQAEFSTADLQFLIDNQVALRFQHQTYEDQFNQNGRIAGDAYSLSDLTQWTPVTAEKAAVFHIYLKALMERIFTYMASSAQGNYAGTLSLLKGVQGAHSPVRDRGGGYVAPFYPVGAFTPFSTTQRVGRLDITEEEIANVRGRTGYFNPEQVAITERIIDDMTFGVIALVKAARTQAELGHANKPLDIFTAADAKAENNSLE